MKNFRQQQHRPKKNTLIIGRKAVIEAMQTGKQLERIYLQGTVHGEVIDEIKKLAEKNLVPINKVPVEKPPAPCRMVFPAARVEVDAALGEN